MDDYMSLDTALFIGMGIFLGLSVLLQAYLAYRIRKYQQNPANTSKSRMTAKESYRFGLFHTLFYSYMIIGAVYLTWNGNFPWLLGVGFIIVGLVSIRKPVKLVRDNRPMHADWSITLPLQTLSTNVVTRELILNILGEESVINAIKNDLQKVYQIGRKEQWRLGLVMPSMDMYDQFFHIPVKRAAILHPTSYFNAQFNRLMIIHGAKEPILRSYPGWTYGLLSPIPDHEYRNICDIEINTNSPSASNRSASFPRFLREDGFPLKASYIDGDPLTTERGGTLVIDKVNIKLIYSNYFIQSRLIDDEGNLIYMGLDENFRPSSTWSGTTVIPSVSKKLFKSVHYEGYTPILRYRSFPYASNFMLPLLDTPMSDSGWADLVIDTRGKAKLFIAKEKTLAEWYEMMERLRQLFFGELEKKGNHLLGLTKDQSHLNEYFSKKQIILEEYFTVIDWSLV
jgi:hypothetical protein